MTRLRNWVRHIAIRAGRPLDRLDDYDGVVFTERRRAERRRSLVRV